MDNEKVLTTRLSNKNESLDGYWSIQLVSRRKKRGRLRITYFGSRNTSQASMEGQVGKLVKTEVFHVSE